MQILNGSVIEESFARPSLDLSLPTQKDPISWDTSHAPKVLNTEYTSFYLIFLALLLLCSFQRWGNWGIDGWRAGTGTLFWSHGMESFGPFPDTPGLSEPLLVLPSCLAHAHLTVSTRTASCWPRVTMLLQTVSLGKPDPSLSFGDSIHWAWTSHYTMKDPTMLAHRICKALKKSQKSRIWDEVACCCFFNLLIFFFF